MGTVYRDSLRMLLGVRTVNNTPSRRKDDQQTRANQWDVFACLDPVHICCTGLAALRTCERFYCDRSPTERTERAASPVGVIGSVVSLRFNVLTVVYYLCATVHTPTTSQCMQGGGH